MQAPVGVLPARACITRAPVGVMQTPASNPSRLSAIRRLQQSRQKLASGPSQHPPASQQRVPERCRRVLIIPAPAAAALADAGAVPAPAGDMPATAARALASAYGWLTGSSKVLATACLAEAIAVRAQAGAVVIEASVFTVKAGAETAKANGPKPRPLTVGLAEVAVSDCY